MKMGKARESGKSAVLGEIERRDQRRVRAHHRDSELLTLPGNAMKSSGSGGVDIEIWKLNVK